MALLPFLCLTLTFTCSFYPVKGWGSTTVLTDNGFPINFLENIANSPTVQQKLKSRWKWEVWDVVPGTHAFQIYVFNITNPDEVEKGEKPNLQQVGPYYYKETRVKFDVSVNLDLTVNFERNFSYAFDASKSNGSETDLVNVLNIPLIIFATVASKYNPALANSAVNDLHSSEKLIARNVPVTDLLYHGMDVTKYQKYLNLLNLNTSSSRDELVEEFSTGRYGILKLKTGTHERPFVVDSGLKNRGKVGEIVTWDGKKALDWWYGERCNDIKGSDSSVFPPYLKESTQVSVLDLDLCRSIDFAYSGPISFKSVQGFTFNLADNTFKSPDQYSPNQCFCKTTTGAPCLKSGALDVSSCRGDAPFVMSYPHFMNADLEYSQAVNGLHPNPAQHQTQIDIEPVTGAVINYRKRFQWNIWLKPLPQIDVFKSVKPMLFPVIWNDDAFHLNPDKAELLMEELASQEGGVGDTLTNKMWINHGSRNSNNGFILFLTVPIAIYKAFST